MTEKPTYEEPRQRVKKLEKEVSELKGTEEESRLIRDKFAGMLAAMCDGVDIITYDYRVVYANDNLKKIIGKAELEGHLCYKVFLDKGCPMRKLPYEEGSRGLEDGNRGDSSAQREGH